MSNPSFPYQPKQDTGGNTSVEASVSNTATALSLPSTVDQSTDGIRITVTGNQSVYWAAGNVSVTLSATKGTKMLANSVEVFGVPPGTTQITHVAPAAGSNISVSVGKGT